MTNIYEYMSFVESVFAGDAKLNDFAQRGWDLVSSVHFTDAGSQRIKHFMRRPKAG